MTDTSAVWQRTAVTGSPALPLGTEIESVGLYFDSLGDIRLSHYWWEQQEGWSDTSAHLPDCCCAPVSSCATVEGGSFQQTAYFLHSKGCD